MNFQVLLILLIIVVIIYSMNNKNEHFASKPTPSKTTPSTSNKNNVTPTPYVFNPTDFIGKLPTIPAMNLPILQGSYQNLEKKTVQDSNNTIITDLSNDLLSKMTQSPDSIKKQLENERIREANLPFTTKINYTLDLINMMYTYKNNLNDAKDRSANLKGDFSYYVNEVDDVNKSITDLMNNKLYKLATTLSGVPLINQ